VSNILITGGCGFIGTNLVKRLLQDGHEIFVIDDLSSGFKQHIHEKIVMIKGSIEDNSKLAECFSYKPDYVIHLAALFANQNSVEHPYKDLSVNGLGMINLLEWCKKTKVKKVLYSSSSCVYGNKIMMNENDNDLCPDTPYAITKLLGENYAKFWSSHHGLDVVTVRLFNVYGPGDFPGIYRSVVPNFIKLALQGKPLIITGTGYETRDFSYLEDVVEGICKVLFAETDPGDIFNIATGIKTSILEIANTINSHCKNNSEIIFEKPRKWDHVIHRQANIDKINSLLGFTPKTGIDEGIKKTCDWLAGIT